MRFANPHCPECGDKATHVLESLFCHTPIEFPDEENDNADWLDAATEVLWDSSEIVREEPDGLVTLHCRACRRSWQSAMQEPPAEVDNRH